MSLDNTPIDRLLKLNQRAPFLDEVINNYDPSEECISIQIYAENIRLRKVKQSL